MRFGVAKRFPFARVTWLPPNLDNNAMVAATIERHHNPRGSVTPQALPAMLFAALHKPPARWLRRQSGRWLCASIAFCVAAAKNQQLLRRIQHVNLR
jgi:hypothetical protein